MRKAVGLKSDFFQLLLSICCIKRAFLLAREFISFEYLLALFWDVKPKVKFLKKSFSFKEFNPRCSNNYNLNYLPFCFLQINYLREMSCTKYNATISLLFAAAFCQIDLDKLWKRLKAWKWRVRKAWIERLTFSNKVLSFSCLFFDCLNFHLNSRQCYMKYFLTELFILNVVIGKQK